jgi:hypothetical protein
MEHEIGSGSPAPGCQARSAEGVMVRRLSVANLDSGAESPVYGKEPSALADLGPVVNPPRADGDGRRAVGSGRTVVGHYFTSGVVVGGRGRAVCAGGIASLQGPQFRATRDITMNVTFVTLRHVGARMPRLATSCDMSVVDQQSGRWYAKDIRASTLPMGTQ